MDYNIPIDPRLLEEDEKRFGSVYSKPTTPYYKGVMVEAYDPVPNPFQHGLYNNEAAMFFTSTGYVGANPRKADLTQQRSFSQGFNTAYDAGNPLFKPGVELNDAGFGCFHHTDVLDKDVHPLAEGDPKLNSHAGTPPPLNAPAARESKSIIKKNYVYRPR